MTTLEELRTRVATLRFLTELADTAADRATPGGLRDYDPAILSGLRRKPNRKADARRTAAYDRAAAVMRELMDAERDLEVAERRAARETADAALPAVTPEMLASAKAARTAKGWALVARVNPKSVSLAAYGCEWKVPHTSIIEVRL